jgi:hypothetical protein
VDGCFFFFLFTAITAFFLDVFTAITAFFSFGGAFYHHKNSTIERTDIEWHNEPTMSRQITGKRSTLIKLQYEEHQLRRAINCPRINSFQTVLCSSSIGIGLSCYFLMVLTQNSVAGKVISRERSFI